MNATIFREWLIKLDKQMKSQDRKILLFLDNFGGHSPNNKEAPFALTNIKIVYFPANCTSVIQPMDQGIIQAFKRRYRTHIVKRKLESIEYGYEIQPITILDSINYIGDAWNNITPQIIKNCYRKAGFKSKELDTVESLNIQIRE